ncbi:hypothetical protein QOZ80_7AG0554430 [Eleusine coracana subsp. coracana]|nr:hypothetical protein QOZ80_7AG0554430 [Eleusine coracana subsp. coracana]
MEKIRLISNDRVRHSDSNTGHLLKRKRKKEKRKTATQAGLGPCLLAGCTWVSGTRPGSRTVEGRAVRVPIDPPPKSSSPPPEHHRPGTMAPPPPELIDDVAAEIFLRLPPDEPEHLFRTSLVCKTWLRIVTDPDFRRRYRAFHRAPPLLGYIQRRQVMEGDPDPRLVPTTAVPLTPNPSFRRALDCRHGRVLVHVYRGRGHLLVWDPVTGDQQLVPDAGIQWLIYSAAVFCAVSGCDHTDCHGGPFRVVFIATDDREELVKVTVHSSETGVWSKPVTLDSGCEAYVQHEKDARDNGGVLGMFYTPYVKPRRGAVIGDEIYFTLSWANAIVKYDWGKNCVSIINSPSRDAYYVSLMEMEDGALGFCYIQDWNLYLWSWKVSSDGAGEWVQSRVIELKGMIPVANPDDAAVVVGSAEGVGVIFVSTDAGLFSFELKSGRVRKVDEREVYFSILPYMSFYTPGHGTLSSLTRTR